MFLSLQKLLNKYTRIVSTINHRKSSNLLNLSPLPVRHQHLLFVGIRQTKKIVCRKQNSSGASKSEARTRSSFMLWLVSRIHFDLISLSWFESDLRSNLLFFLLSESFFYLSNHFHVPVVVLALFWLLGKTFWCKSTKRFKSFQPKCERGWMGPIVCSRHL